MPAEPRTCPICWTTFTPDGRNRHKHTYCSGRCRSEAGRRRAHGTDTTMHRPTPTPGRPEPAAQRDCPHCGHTITIVALLTTPQIAGPQPATGTPDIVPLHRVRAT